jgi:hypothetical protein
MRPDFNISGLSAAANDRLLSLTVTESTQGKSDSATFTLDDRDYLIEVPKKGQIITVMIGYKETGLSPAGEYMVDQIRHKDAQAATFEITANAQKHRGQPIKVRKDTFHDEITIGALVAKIAAKSGYTPKVDPEIAGFFYNHIDQNEADAHLLQKLSVFHDCYVKFENNTLIFWKRDNALGAVTVARGAGNPTGVSLTASVHCRNEYEGVAANWHNLDSGETYREIAGTESKMMKILPRSYSNKAEAAAAAKAEFSRLNRGTGTIESLSIPGDPSIRAGRKLLLTGFRPEFCALEWMITEVSHNIGGGGFQTTVKAEVSASKAIDGGGGGETTTQAGGAGFGGLGGI